MVQATTMPTVAATAAKTREFLKLFMVSTRPNTVFQLERVKFPARKTLLPTSILKEVKRIVPKGITMTTTAKRATITVSGSRQERRSTIAGRTDLPETVMYCRLASTTSDRKRMMTASSIRKTARPVASLRPR